MHKVNFIDNYVKGLIKLFWVKNGVWTLFHEQSNLVTYEAADILAAAVAGTRKIDGIYVAFENDSGAVEYTAAPENNAAYYAVEEADRSFVRVTTLGEPIIEQDGTEYNGNKITFLGVTDGTSFFPASPLTDSVSVMYHSALVSRVDGGVQDSDKIFSCADFAVPVTKIAGSQLGVRWELVFNKP